MFSLYGLCAVIGGTVLVCQFVMALIGLSGDHDLSNLDGDLDLGDPHVASGHGPGPAADGHAHSGAHPHSSTWFFGVVSFRTIMAAIAFFGLTGLAVQSSGGSDPQTLAIAVGAGVAAMFGVHWLMQQMSRLNADGTIGMTDAVGRTGTVYLKIQAHHQGAGKVTLNVHNRTVEFDARTAGEELPTGTQVLVLGVLGPDTVEVSRVPAGHEVTHA